MAAIDPLANAGQLIQRVYAYAAYRLRAETDAEDATSRTFERALRHRDRYDPQRGEPIAWLLGIARRCVADVIAERDRELPACEDQLQFVAESADSYSLADDVIRRLTLRELINQLPDRDRELIALRYGADLTARQIATLTNNRTNAIEVALHRALTRLRSAFPDSAGSPTGGEGTAHAGPPCRPTETKRAPHPDDAPPDDSAVRVPPAQPVSAVMHPVTPADANS